MYVCICKDVNSKQIKKALADGIDDMQALQNTLEVATCCGSCEPMVQDLLDEHHTNKVVSLAIAV